MHAQPPHRGSFGAPRIAASDAQRLIDLIGCRLLPAVAGGLLAYVHTDVLGYGLLVCAAIFGAAQLVARIPYPLHLMSATRVALGVATPALGIALLLPVALSNETVLSTSDLVAPVIGATLIAALGQWVKARLQESRPVRVAVIGPPLFAAALRQEMRDARVDSYTVLGWVGMGDPEPGLVEGVERLGTLDEIRSVVTENSVDLLVCAPEASADRRQMRPHGRRGDRRRDATGAALRVYEAVAGACLDLPVRMIDSSQLYEQVLGHVPNEKINAAWYRYLMHPSYKESSRALHRLFDLGFALAAALVALPVVAVAAVAIKLGDRGPVIYRQRRVGEHGTEFEILKLRTMALDSEPMGPVWTSSSDARVTRVGKLLRRIHVDELPQLWNVLRGEMRLVGPRPERPELVAQLESEISHYEPRHLVKPGITGWAQIRCGYGGSQVGTAWKLCHDLYYLKHRSLVVDVLLMLETLTIVGRDGYDYERTTIDEPPFLDGAHPSGEAAALAERAV